MSRGLGKLQRGIVELLHGRISPRVCTDVDPTKGMIAAELVAELVASGALSDATDHEFQMASVRRACWGLVDRGLARSSLTTGADGRGSRIWFAPAAASTRTERARGKR